MLRFKVLLFTCFLAVISSARNYHAPLDDTQYFETHLSPKIREIMLRQDIPGLSIAIVHGRDLALAKGFGFANLENNVAAAPDTVYGIGSVSKVFTATAFMQLAENGIVDIHKPVKDYLPRFRIEPPRNLPQGSHNLASFGLITPFNLMIHYSGMPKEPPPRPRDLVWIPQSLAELMQDLYTRSRLIYPPNFRYSYSNPGISVLGRIIEVVSNQDFEAYMQHHVLQPLNMATSSFSNRGFSPEIMNKLAQGYEYRDKPVERPPIRGIPAGNLHSTVLDIANFIKMYLNNGTYQNRQIIKPETINQMFSIQNETLRERDPEHIGPDQGLVWILSNPGIPGNPKVARHNGKMVGFSSVLILLPEEHLGVVVLTNIRNHSIKPSQIAQAALAVARERY